MGGSPRALSPLYLPTISPVSPPYLPDQVGEPWRLAEGALRDWKVPLDLQKNGHSMGKIILSIAVYDHMVARLPPPNPSPNPNPNPNPNPPT